MENEQQHYNSYGLPTRTIYQPEYQHLTHTPVITPDRQVTMSNGYTNTGYLTQSNQGYNNGRGIIDMQSVKNFNEISTYDTLVDDCSCNQCKNAQFDFQKCQTRSHSQAVEPFDTNYSGQILNTATEIQFLNQMLDHTDPFRTNFSNATTPEPAIVYGRSYGCNEVERSNSSGNYAQIHSQNFNPVEQGITEFRQDLGARNKKPKSHSIELIDDRAISITFGPEKQSRYAILNLSRLVPY